MTDDLKKKIEGEIDKAIASGAEMDAAYAAAGHVDLTTWRDLFGKRRGVLAEQATAKKPGKTEETPPK